MGARIAGVIKGSIADTLRLRPGDQILSVNGIEPADLIRFQWEWAGEAVRLEALTEDGVKVFDIVKGYDENPGIDFETPVFDGIRRCANRCVFCFVDQQPPNLRESLYIKDDDYRLSFLQGAYITMTNLTESDLRRIEEEKLSPLYISVHASDPALRSVMLGRSGEDDRLMETMSRLSGRGIEFHCQIVLCPGYNDGEVLFKTIEDLGKLGGVISVAVVPVGLTRFREGLPVIRPVSKAESLSLIDRFADEQEKFLKEKGSRFVWLSDEFYVIAGVETPQASSYEDYPQWENGVGLIRNFLDEALGVTLPAEISPERRLVLAGGVAAMSALGPLWERLRQIKGLTVVTIGVENHFFGPDVNVSGLLTGECLSRGLSGRGLAPGETVYLSGVMLKNRGALNADDDVFLDDISAGEVSEKLGLRLVFLPERAKEALKVILD